MVAHVIASMWRNRRVLASGATVATAAIVVSTLAVLYPGVPTADLELDDGGVWVTKSDDLLVGHLNYPSRVLDGAVRTRAAEFDILQIGERVLILDQTTGAVSPIDPARVEVTGDTALPSEPAVALGGDTVAVRGGGFLYALSFSSLGGATFSEDDALAAIGNDGAVAVSRDGTKVFAVSTGDQTLTTVELATGSAQVVAFADLPEDAEIALEVIGDRPVAFDSKYGVVYRADGTSVPLDNAQAGALQQSSESTDAAYVATTTGLVRIPLEGGEATQVASVPEGIPASPVWLNGCVYAVWSGSAHYVRDCAGDEADLDTKIETDPGAALVLRTNRRVVVVNDTRAGTVWVVNDQIDRVENWDDVVPPADDESEDEESEEEQPQFDLPERSAQNNPPTAEDDQYGVRAGRSTILRVTENDTDPDGDLLAAAPLGDPPAGLEITTVLGGAALQVSVPANATGSASFAYRVDDGRDGTDEATVTLTVRPPDQNEPPRQKEKVETLQVEAGGSVTYDALQGWFDPDGDDFYLTAATVEGGDTVAFRTSGVIEYNAASKVVGLKEVALVVSDGASESEGALRVDVRPEGSLNPVANADRVVATAGVPITVSPLANDLSPTGEVLRLTKTDYPAGARITPDYAGGTFEFVADVADAYYVQYSVTVGARSAVGLVRVDVVAAGSTLLPPVAVRDLALLPSGRDVLVDVLANDTDPGGGILVVQSARIAANAGLGVEVLQHSVLRITDTSGLSAPTTIAYIVSNGTQSATGEVLVVPVPLPATLRPPVAVDDSAIVRAGDVVTIPVLDNDYHPDNDLLTLQTELRDVSGADTGAVFVDGDRVRVHAPSEPGTLYFAYDIVDSQAQKVGAYVTVQVIPADESTNSPPRPKPVVARVVAGNTARIAIPLDGIDDNGDSVELVGVTSIPSKGRVTVGDTWLTYEAYPTASGRDTFTYQVRDRLGAVADSTITVGVAAPGYENQAPYAVKDIVVVKPGRRVAVAVTVNDSDPDGDEITIDPDALVAPSGSVAEIEGGRVVLTAPDEPGDYTLTYGIADAFGAVAQGVLLVTVSDTAPAAPPIARDDRVSVLSVGSDATVDVAVLENDEDPDGTTDALEIATFSDTAAVRAGGIVRVELLETSQIIRYSLTDEDGGVGQAFVLVPGLSELAPVLKTIDPVTVVSGENVLISLADYVRVREGKTPRIATADSVRTGHSNGDSLIADEATLSYTSAVDFYGSDTIGVLVTDGAGPDDPEGRTGFVSIPITVLPASNQSPTLRNAAIVVAPGEDAVTLNLRKLAYDPDEGDLDKLAFEIDGATPQGYEATIAGDVLSVRAGADVQAGSAASLAVRVSDGTSAPASGAVSISAVTSQRPFPVANDDVVAKANQGQTYRVDVLANDFNPFADRGALTIEDARLDSGDGEVVVDGDRVAITPAASFVGTMIVTYRIGDATKASDREAEGRVTLTVQGKPSAPGVPTVTSIQDRTVVLSWGPPSNNGAPIIDYTVSSQNGYSKVCTSTVCTLDNLTNDVEYTFQVTARNEVGESDASPVSAAARPDARPDTPAPPTLQFGDKSLTVTWATPRSTGSPVVSYNLEISPAPAFGSIQKAGVTGNSITWDGLENGVAYQVRVQAVNRAPEPSEWGPYSATMVPAGVPDAPGAPQTTAATPVGAQAQIAVSWAPPASANGDQVADYTLTVKRGGSVVTTITTAALSQNVVVDASETDYTFSVSARNKAGSSPQSADSAPRRGAVSPGAPTNVVATPADGSANITFTPGPLNGNRAGEITYRYRVNQTGAQGTLPAGGGSVGGLANGTSYTFNVWATSSVSGVQPGAESTSTAAVPFGKPIITLQSIERLDNAVRFRWTVNENGRALTQSSYGAAGSNEYTATGLAAGQSTTLNVSYSNEAGQSAASWSGQANDPPPERVWVTRSGNTLTMHWENRTSNWSGVTAFRCWSVPPNTQQGGHGGSEGGNGTWITSGTMSAVSGSVNVSCGASASDNYSIEAWKNGPWLQVGRTQGG